MSDCNLKSILEKIARKYNCKIWINKKIGRRISFIEKAGNEYYLPPMVVYEDDKFIIFVENLKRSDEKLKKLIQEVVDCARNN